MSLKPAYHPTDRTTTVPTGTRSEITLRQLLERDSYRTMSVERNFTDSTRNNNITQFRPTFKQRKSFATRRDEVAGIKSKFPSKIPVIVERYYKEISLPALDKTKFLVPQELTMSQFSSIIRNRMLITNAQAFYLITNNRSVTSMSRTVAEVYDENRDEDGFLYITYASQAMFG